MKKNAFWGIFTVFIYVIASAQAMAESTEPPLTVEKIWATPTFPMAMMGAAYFTVQNTSAESVQIAKLSVDAGVANMAELHESYVEGEIAKMRELSMPYEIAAGETLVFQPGGKHIMLMGLKGGLEAGQTFNVTLHFSNGLSQMLNVSVRESDSDQMANEHDHH